MGCEKINTAIKSLVQWTLLTGLLLGLAMPLVLLGLAIKSSGPVAAGVVSFLLAVMALVIMGRSSKEVAKLVKEECTNE